MSKNTRLTPKEIDLYPEYLDDHLTLVMYNIENALLKVGALPNQDYSIKDLMNWAVQLCQEESDEKKMQWTPRNPSVN